MATRKYIFDYQEPPRLGHRKEYFKGLMLTLTKVEPYQRRDGSNAFVLTWKADDGRVGTSGLRCGGMNWVPA